MGASVGADGPTAKCGRTQTVGCQHGDESTGARCESRTGHRHEGTGELDDKVRNLGLHGQRYVAALELRGNFLYGLDALLEEGLGLRDEAVHHRDLGAEQEEVQPRNDVLRRRDGDVARGEASLGKGCGAAIVLALNQLVRADAEPGHPEDHMVDDGVEVGAALSRVK
eukprot:SAG11_NODE_9961_length_866_cov_1.099087_1_plen_168_part_00